MTDVFPLDKVHGWLTIMSWLWCKDLILFYLNRRRWFERNNDITWDYWAIGDEKFTGFLYIELLTYAFYIHLGKISGSRYLKKYLEILVCGFYFQNQRCGHNLLAFCWLWYS